MNPVRNYIYSFIFMINKRDNKLYAIIINNLRKCFLNISCF